MRIERFGMRIERLFNTVYIPFQIKILLTDTLNSTLKLFTKSAHVPFNLIVIRAKKNG